MQQAFTMRRQTAIPTPASGSSRLTKPQSQATMPAGMERSRHAGAHRQDSAPLLTNGDPPPLMLWGEEV